MPRTGRETTGGLFCHVLNRGDARGKVFHSVADYQEFEGLIAEAVRQTSMRIAGWCLLPNHFHLVVWPRADGDLSRFMQWLTTCHVRRYHRRYGGSGPIWQGRFKSFPIQRPRMGTRMRSAPDANPLWLVVRYVERNALRAGLVRRAQDWRWSSLYWWVRPAEAAPIPISLARRPAHWLELVNQPLTEKEFAEVRQSADRPTPLGANPWTGYFLLSKK